MELYNLINNSQNIVVFTGAGISTDSGIPDFRSSSGMYMNGEFEGYRPDTILTRAMLRKNPLLVLNFYKKRLMSMVDKKPNKAHLSLKRLQDIGKLNCVITQNIDNLHNKCGTKNVFELHGNITRYHCNNSCGNLYSHEQFLEKIGEGFELPLCDCKCSFIRPDVVLFDEWLNDDIFNEAYIRSKTCNLFIVIGSSLVVEPACSLIREINSDCKLVIINKDTTQYDKKAILVINENCGDVLESVINRII